MTVEEKKAETLAMATDVSNRTQRVLQHIEKGEWVKAHAESSEAMIQALRMLQAVAIMKAIDEGLVKVNPKPPKSEPERPMVWVLTMVQFNGESRELIEAPDLNDSIEDGVKKVFDEFQAMSVVFKYRPTNELFTVRNLKHFKEVLPKMQKLEEQQAAGKASHLWTGETSPPPE